MMMLSVALSPSLQNQMPALAPNHQGNMHATTRFGGAYHQAAADVFVTGGAKALGYTPTFAEHLLRSMRNVFPKVTDMVSALVGGKVGFDFGKSVATTAQLSENQTIAAGVVGGMSGASIGLKFSRWLKHNFGSEMFKALKDSVIGH
ncbi:MAG: hypothetical protein ACKO37_00800 [Vampirovibrionales bacterium]